MPLPSIKNLPNQDYAPCPVGTYRACIVRVYYLGTQPTTDPKYKPAKKLAIVFEVDEPLEAGSDKNYLLTATVGYSLGDKSGLTKLLKPALTNIWPKEGDDWSAESLLSLKCLVTVTHYEKNGAMRAGIGSVGGLMKGMAPFEGNSAEFCWSYDDPPRDDVPDWVKTAAAAALELGGSVVRQPPAPAAGTTVPASNGHVIDPDLNSCPF